MRVVLDTNILVSRFLVPSGNPARIMGRWEAGAFELLVSEAILAECRRVLGYQRIRKKHNYTDDEADKYIAGLGRLATVVSPGEAPDAVEADPDDNRIIECAQTGEADYIVTGDNHLRNLGSYAGIQILTPTAFLLLLEREAPKNGA
jgi:putative PIN family toxin of toxin-antitoxin system